MHILWVGKQFMRTKIPHPLPQPPKKIMDHRKADLLWVCHAILPLRRWGGMFDKP